MGEIGVLHIERCFDIRGPSAELQIMESQGAHVIVPHLDLFYRFFGGVFLVSCIRNTTFKKNAVGEPI